MKFEMIRLMLAHRDQGDLFSNRESQSANEYLLPLPREKWLRSRFSEAIYFEHRNTQFAYVPSVESPRDMVVGKIGRRRTVKENEPPEGGLASTERKVWKAADFVLDSRQHEDGQKVAMADDAAVGRPLALVQSLVAAINARVPSEPFFIEANAISDPETFFQFVRENPRDVTSVSFELVVPNMFGIRTELDEEMRQLRDNEKAKKAKLVLQSEDGLDLDTERARQTAAYAAEGGGSIFAKTRNGKRFSSRKKGKTVIIPSPIEEEDRSSLLAKIIDKVFGQ